MKFSIVGLMCITLWAQSGPSHFERYTSRDGLSQSTVSSIWQDKQGFLWLGSRNGLNKFDGYRFSVYKTHPSDTTTISDNWITVLTENADGLWIGAANRGLNLLQAGGSRFIRFSSTPRDSQSLMSNSITALCTDSKGRVWVGTKSGLHRIENQGGKFVFLRFKNQTRWITALAADSDGVVWIGTKTGVDKFFEDQITSAIDLKKEGVSALRTDANNNLWIGTGQGLRLLDKNTSVVSKIASGTFSETLPVNTLYYQTGGIMWIGTLQGLYHYTIRTGVWQLYRRNDADPNSLADNEVRAIFLDRAQNLWIGTYGGGGFSKLDLKPKKFAHVKRDTKDPNALSNNVIRTFFEDRAGNLWVGTHEGLSLKTVDGFKTFHKAQGLQNEEARALAEDDENNLWVGTEGGGLHRWDGKKFKVFQNDPKNPNSIGQNEISSLMADSKKILWVGTFRNGLDRMNIATGEFAHFRHDPKDSSSISANEVSMLFRDKKNRLWVGTFGGGLSRLDLNASNGIFRHFQNQKLNPNSLSSNVIYSMAEDDQGRILVGTNEGLSIMEDPEINFFQRFYEKDGLPDNYIYGVEADGDRLWISTGQGISQMIVNRTGGKTSASFRNYDERDGLQGREFKFGAYYKKRDGQILFGGTNGYNIFNPQFSMDNPNIPNVAWASLKKKDKNANVFSEISIPGHSEVLELNYGDDFTAEFSALEFTDPPKNQYAYELTSFDPGWIYSGSRRLVTYTHLDPGEYTLRVKASNNDGVWNEKAQELNIRIVPPFWMTWWFRIGSSLALGLIIFMGIQYRIRAVHEQKNRLEIEVSNRTREIRLQRDELKDINLKLEQTLQSLRETQEHLLQSEKMAALGQFVGGIAHEINNPLAITDGNIYLIEENLQRWEALLNSHAAENEMKALREETMSMLNSCKKGTLRIKNIVQDLREFSRVDSQGLTPYNINDGLEATLRLLKPILHEGIEIEKKFGALPLLNCNAGTLNQTFMNILRNAVEFISGSGKITIVTMFVDNQFQVRISDTGRGMTDEIKKNIFNPFYTTKPIGQGMGLGLSISYTTVRKHGGNITVESQLGKGSEFTVTLPKVFAS